MPSEFLVVDPRTLRASARRTTGADPLKLARQIASFGSSTAGMQPPWVWRCKDGELMIVSGMTRVTRVAKLMPGQLIRVEVTEEYANYDVSRLPTIGDLVP